MEPQWVEGRKVCSSLGHMTKMATMSIYYKISLKSSFLEPTVQWLLGLVCSIIDMGQIKFEKIMTLG